MPTWTVPRLGPQELLPYHGGPRRYSGHGFELAAEKQRLADTVDSEVARIYSGTQPESPIQCCTWVSSHRRRGCGEARLHRCIFTPAPVTSLRTGVNDFTCWTCECCSVRRSHKRAKFVNITQFSKHLSPQRVSARTRCIVHGRNRRSANDLTRASVDKHMQRADAVDRPASLTSATFTKDAASPHLCRMAHRIWRS